VQTFAEANNSTIRSQTELFDLLDSTRQAFIVPSPSTNAAPIIARANGQSRQFSTERQPL
jgi:hypothetical protein